MEAAILQQRIDQLRDLDWLEAPGGWVGTTPCWAAACNGHGYALSLMPQTNPAPRGAAANAQPALPWEEAVKDAKVGWPVALLMGVPPADCTLVGQLLGTKSALTGRLKQMAATASHAYPPRDCS